jgi:putative tryptophan/tyrosine transport system substrate-binding protein
MLDLRRRQVFTLVGGAVAWPFAARGQQPSKFPTIGFLGGASAAVESQWAATFARRLHELGWTEGRTVAIEYRWAEGHNETAEIVAEFVRLKVNIIVTYGTPSILAAKQATSIIPIVFAAAGDPVRTGIVASLARPGGNVTGLSLLATDLTGKRIELLREVVPGFRRLALLGNIGNPQVVVEIGEVQATARTLGLDVVTSSEIRKAEDVAPAFESFKGRADALFVVLDPLINNNRLPIATLALGARLPTMHGLRDLVEAGGLMSYAANFPDLFRRAAGLVDKILRGVKPAEIPVEQPTKFDLVVNLNTAKALGLTIPETFLARADEVIE